MPSGGRAPSPITPFSAWKKTSTSSGRKFATMLRSPMPRFTSIPSFTTGRQPTWCSRISASASRQSMSGVAVTGFTFMTSRTGTGAAALALPSATSPRSS